MTERQEMVSRLLGVAVVVGVMLLLAATGYAQSNLAPHLVERLRKDVGDFGAKYVDTYSDGRVVESVVPWPETPVSLHLVATNDAGQAWRLDYKATYVAAGVASDSAQGQVTTSTATATISAWPGSRPHQ